MDEPVSERRFAENEVIFRQKNEKLTDELAMFKSSADAEGHGELADNIDIPLHFYCECSDDKCRQRIVLTPSEYKQLHQNRRQFVLVPGHQVAEFERVVTTTDKYIVVEKRKLPPESANTMNATPLDKS